MATILEHSRPLILGAMSVPDLWAALQEADRDENRLMDRVDALSYHSPRHEEEHARLDACRARQAAIEVELRNRVRAFTGGVDFSEIATRLM